MSKELGTVMKSGQYPVVSGQWLKKTLRVLDYVTSRIMILQSRNVHSIYTVFNIVFNNIVFICIVNFGEARNN